MDSFDDFEMKPITEGLGFHKKSINLKKNKFDLTAKSNKIPKAPPFIVDQPKQDIQGQAQESLKSSLDRLLDSLNQESEAMTQDVRQNNWDLGARKSVVEDSPQQTQTTQHMDSIDQTPDSVPAYPPFEPPQTESHTLQNETDEFPLLSEQELLSRSASDTPPIAFKKATFSVSAFVLDAFVALSISLAFLVSFLVLSPYMSTYFPQLFGSEIDIALLFENIQTDRLMQGSLVVLYLVIWVCYMIGSRSFVGKTLGDWTFDYQLGNDQQINSALYPFKVILRTFVILLTGIFVLPIFSILFRKDLSGALSGTQLFKRINNG